MSTLQAEIKDGLNKILGQDIKYLIKHVHDDGTEDIALSWGVRKEWIEQILKFLDSKQVAIIRIPQRGEDLTGSVLCFLKELING